MPVQAYHDTGFTLQDPLAGRRVVLVQYPPVRSRLPAPLRTYLDSWFAAGAAPPPGLRVQFVPLSLIHISALRRPCFYVRPQYTRRGTKSQARRHNPVSYTHLDVYKRQPQRRGRAGE